MRVRYGKSIILCPKDKTKWAKRQVFAHRMLGGLMFINEDKRCVRATGCLRHVAKDNPLSDKLVIWLYLR